MMNSFAMHLGPFLAWLLRTTWQAGILIVLVLVIQKVMGRRLSVRGRYCLWFLVLIRMAVPWTHQSPVSVYNVLPPSPLRSCEAPAASAPAPAPAQTAADSAPTQESPPIPSPELANSGVFIPLLVESPPAQRGRWPGLQARTIILLSLVWFAGAGSLAGCILASSIRLRGIVRRGQPVTDLWILDLLDECKRRIGTRIAVGAIATPGVGGPALTGFWRPRLLLPRETLAAADRAELRHIFLHELAHLKRHDILVGWIAGALHVLHWFNPLVALGFRQMRADRELACDGLALSVLDPEETVAYGHTIVRQIERLLRARPRWMLARLSGDRARIKERIDMISRFRRESYRWSLLAVMLIGCVACVGLTEGFTAAATWDEYARRDFPTTHQDKHENILRVSIRHTQTDRFLVAHGDGISCNAIEPGAGGLWETRFDEDAGNDPAHVVYFYSVATRKYLTWDRDGDGVRVSVSGLGPDARARWAIWNMGGAGARIVPYPFAHFYLRALEQGQVKTPYGTDPGMFWEISGVWRVKTSDDPKSNPQWRREHVPGPD